MQLHRIKWNNKGLKIVLLSCDMAGTSTDIAKLLGIDKHQALDRWNTGRFTREEMLVIKETLNLNMDEFLTAFFYELKGCN